MNLVLVACGGNGKRLGYLGQKCLIPTAGRPFIHWRLDQLVAAGADELVLLISHEGGTVWNSVGERWAGIQVSYLSDPTQTAGGRSPWTAVRKATKHLPDMEFWVAWGDVLHDYTLEDLSAPTMIVTAESPVEPYNVDGTYLDTGLYKVSTGDPHPAQFNYHPQPGRTWTITTPELHAETEQHLEAIR